MDSEDTKLLNDMKNLMLTFQGEFGLAEVAAQIATWRDRLAFHDREWERQLTQHIVTLDSASTFVPRNDQERVQYQTAIQTAVAEIVRMVDEKLN